MCHQYGENPMDIMVNNNNTHKWALELHIKYNLAPSPDPIGNKAPTINFPQDCSDRADSPSVEERERGQTSTAGRVTPNISPRLGVAWVVALTRVMVRDSWVLFGDVSEILEGDHSF